MANDFSTHSADAIAYIMEAYAKKFPIHEEKYKSAVAIMNEYRREKEMSSCGRIEHEMRELRRCGCDSCRDRYESLERQYYRMPLIPVEYYKSPAIMRLEQSIMDTKIAEEPKNYAVKLLVDQLKAQQNQLGSAKTMIEQDKTMLKNYQNSIKTKNTAKLAIENKIKELSVALKKLGHKE